MLKPKSYQPKFKVGDIAVNDGTYIKVERDVTEKDYQRNMLSGVVIEDLNGDCYIGDRSNNWKLDDFSLSEIPTTEDNDIIHVGNGRMYSRRALRAAAEDLFQKYLKSTESISHPTSQSQEPKFRKGDVVHNAGTSIIVTEDSPSENSTDNYFSGIVIKDTDADFYVGYESDDWALSVFTKVNLDTHFI